MANVLESKNVEAQVIEELDRPSEPTADSPETPQHSPQAVIEGRQVANRLKAEEARKVQALQMARARVREQLSRTSNERYTTLLNTELQQIESELEKLA